MSNIDLNLDEWYLVLILKIVSAFELGIPRKESDSASRLIICRMGMICMIVIVSERIFIEYKNA